MKRSLTTLLLAVLTTLATAAVPHDKQIEKRVEKQLRTMSLDEKIGQMCEITLGSLHDKKNRTEVFEFDQQMLDSTLRHYYTGSILNTPGLAQTTEQWGAIIGEIQRISMESIGIPCIYGLDQIHGATYTMGSTFFPQGINMAASFNTELMRQSSAISAYETRASNVAWTYAPTMDLGRDPRWSRMWESYGEDPLVNARMGSASVLGFQGEDPNNIGPYNIAACLKHYLGYGVPVSGKDRTPSSISHSDLREKYFASFKAAIEAGALSVMVNSGINNGVPLHANYELLTEWLKEDLDWDGMIVSDWNDINNLHTRDRIASSKKEAIKLAINAGIDMSMVPYDLSFCRDLKELVEEGEVPMSRIDDAVRRVLRLKYRLGLFENPTWSRDDYPKFGSEEFAQVSLEAARQSQILLKNEGDILPIKAGTKILITGPNSNTMSPLNGGWSYTWQGEQCDIYAAQHNTIYEAMVAKYGADDVTHIPSVVYSTAQGAKWSDDEVIGFDEMVAAAAEADVIMVCVGENSYCETPGNLTDLNLSENQKQMVRILSELQKPILMVLNEGRPRLIGDIEPLVGGVINSLLPSNYGADALAELISGEANFSAKLPYTYPREINSLTTYDFKPSESQEVMSGDYNYDAKIDLQWPFGFGLSYTNYEYTNLTVTPTTFTADDELEIRVTVSNVGQRDGMEAVLLYSSDIYASMTPDNRRLRDFTKIELKAGESREVVMTIAASDLAFVGYDGLWRLEEGDFVMSCGDERATINCSDTYIWSTPNIE